MPEFINTRDILGDQETLDGLVSHTLTELKDDKVVELTDYALYHNESLVTVEFPNLISSGDHAFRACENLVTVSLGDIELIPASMFRGCKKLTNISCPKVNEIRGDAFSGCSSLSSLDFPLVTRIFNNAFDNCLNLESINLPLADNIGNEAFRYTPMSYLSLPSAKSIPNSMVYGFSVGTIDLAQKITDFNSRAFREDYNLYHLILRNSELSPLQSSGSSVFEKTPIDDGFGYIYVPSDLVNTYKNATNWSVYANQIYPISEYPKEPIGTITDSWSDIFESENDGTYLSKYSIGDTKFIKINEIPVRMEIVAFDADELSNNTGNAKITWLCSGYQSSYVMNHDPNATGGWASSDLRQRLHDIIFNKIQSDVKQNIKPVNKTYRYNNTTMVSTDYIWIPSNHELGFGSNISENNGAVYSTRFTNNASRIKYPGVSSSYPGEWWVRSSYGTSPSFYMVSSNGSNGSTSSPDYNKSIVFGFCT